MANSKNVPLRKTDQEIIPALEKILGVQLPLCERLSSLKTGYTRNRAGEVTGISLYKCKIKDLTPLSQMTGLQTLYLFQNQVSDLTPLSQMTGLQSLDLDNNQVSDLSPLSQMTGLQYLDLRSNQASDLTPLSQMTGLQGLYFRSNQVSNLTPLAELTGLQELDLSENQVSDLTPLSQMTELQDLDLRKNKIETLPPWIVDLDTPIKWDQDYSGDGIILSDNPLKTPPPEIVQQGNAVIRNYFQQLQEQAQDYLFEAKMLILGEPGAGKTSLAGKIEDGDCPLPGEDDTTRGIQVRPYRFPLGAGDCAGFEHPEKLAGREFQLNLWDFGGQDIYKATHRFFLSKRSLYALVADSRNEDTDFNYWLHIIEMFGADSPLLIVLNEKYQRQRHLDVAAMRGRFSNIVDVIDVDFDEADKTRLHRLTKAIRYHVTKLPHIGSPVPAKWREVRAALEDHPANTITLEAYLRLCADNGIAEAEDALVLSQYFHDIGVCLHFQDDDLLNRTLFLKPNWATNAVYKILDAPLLNAQNGRVNKADAKSIWHEAEYQLLRDELLRLMQKFFLTYEIGNSGEYIVPERLPAVQPTYPWPEKGNLFLRYEYDVFMPKGILSQFIVKMHRYIDNHDWVWRRGVILEREETRTEVIESYDARDIGIRVAGRNCRDFMTVITEQFDAIHEQFEKMKVEKRIPCNCAECKSASKPFFFAYPDLKRRLTKGRREVECGVSYEMVNVRGLIDDVLVEKARWGEAWDEGPGSGPRPPRNVKREKVFVSYSHKDGEWLQRVQTHLKVLENFGIDVNLWDDTQIKAGMKWRDEIERGLAAARVAILLVSTDFLASDFITKDELPPLLKAAEREGTAILPMILKPCLYTDYPQLSAFQAVNDPNQPLSTLSESEQDEHLVELAKRVRELMQVD